jgi:hypothetical protein
LKIQALVVAQHNTCLLAAIPAATADRSSANFVDKVHA